MTEEYKNHTISSEPVEDTVGWRVAVSIVDGAGKPVKTQWSEEFRERIYATYQAAQSEGIKAAKNWIRGLHPDEQFIPQEPSA